MQLRSVLYCFGSLFDREHICVTSVMVCSAF